MGAILNSKTVWSNFLKTGTELLSANTALLGEYSTNTRYVSDAEELGITVQTDTIPINFTQQNVKNGLKVSMQKIIVWDPTHVSGNNYKGILQPSNFNKSYYGSYTNPVFSIPKSSFNSNVIIAKSDTPPDSGKIGKIFAKVTTTGIQFSTIESYLGESKDGLVLMDSGSPGTVIGVIDSITTY